MRELPIALIVFDRVLPARTFRAPLRLVTHDTWTSGCDRRGPQCSHHREFPGLSFVDFVDRCASLQGFTPRPVSPLVDTPLMKMRMSHQKICLAYEELKA